LKSRNRLAKLSNLWRFTGVVILLLCALLAKGYWNATQPPLIRTAHIAIPEWPTSLPPLRILHVSDIHVAGPDMPPARLSQIVARFNTLKPDIVLIAGDLVSEKRLATHIYSSSEIVAPLGGLRARFGVIAVLGNHDHWFDPQALRTDLEKQGITVLQNEAVRRGALVIGGVDDDFSGHDNLLTTFHAMDALGPGPRILLTHSPDIVPELPKKVTAVFAGHTHCGQIILPIVGALAHMSRYGERFACGLINYNDIKVIVGAGLGTSLLPLRFGLGPDAWLVTLGGDTQP
jgi:uncharacterized protein